MYKEEFTREVNRLDISGTKNSLTQIIRDLKSTVCWRINQQLITENSFLGNKSINILIR